MVIRRLSQKASQFTIYEPPRRHADLHNKAHAISKVTHINDLRDAVLEFYSGEKKEETVSVGRGDVGFLLGNKKHLLVKISN